MSEALEYLAAVRPEAATHYLKFLKESSRHLDDKTRFLISVATKVISGSESGFRQYMPQAMEAGATPNEIVDAMLCAFPAAGLTRVLNAINWLLEMDLPEFQPENLARETAWREVTDIDDLPEGESVRVSADGRSFFAYREGDTVRLFDGHCSHQLNDVSHLQISDNRLTCPRHGWVFDLTNGECVDKGRRPLKSYEVKVEDGRLLAFL